MSMTRYAWAVWSILLLSQTSRAAEPTTTVVLTATADCAVYVDGGLVHAALKANAVHKIQLAPGEHLFTAECANRKGWKQIVQVGPDQKVVEIDAALSVSPAPLPGPAVNQEKGVASSGTEATNCRPAGVPIAVCHYGSGTGFSSQDCCMATLTYDATQISIAPDTSRFHAGFRLASLCPSLCFDTSQVEEIGENSFFGKDLGAFHIKLKGGTSYNLAPVDLLGKPQGFRTKGMVKFFKEKTGK